MWKLESLEPIDTYCRGRDSLEPIELSLIYRGARTIEFFAGRGFTRVKETDQRHNCPQYKGVCIIEVNTVRSLGEGRGGAYIEEVYTTFLIEEK